MEGAREQERKGDTRSHRFPSVLVGLSNFEEVAYWASVEAVKVLWVTIRKRDGGCEGAGEEGRGLISQVSLRSH